MIDPIRPVEIRLVGAKALPLGRFFPRPITPDYVIPQRFTATFDDKHLPLVTLTIDARGKEPRCTKVVVETRRGEDEITALRKLPIDELRRQAIAEAAVPKNNPSIYAALSSEERNEIRETVLATLPPRRKSRVSDQRLRLVARLYEAALADPDLPFTPNDYLQRALHVAKQTVDRQVRAARAAGYLTSGPASYQLPINATRVRCTVSQGTNSVQFAIDGRQVRIEPGRPLEITDWDRMRWAAAHPNLDVEVIEKVRIIDAPLLPTVRQR